MNPIAEALLAMMEEIAKERPVAFVIAVETADHKLVIKRFPDLDVVEEGFRALLAG